MAQDESYVWGRQREVGVEGKGEGEGEVGVWAIEVVSVVSYGGGEESNVATPISTPS